MENKNVLNYTLTRQLGKGGMAEVWYAENEIGNVAAVKILNEDLSHNAQIVERFRNEAKVTVKLKHPNIRQVYDYAVLDGCPCMVMEYLEGADLSTRMKHGERFTDEQLRKWWNQLASALNYTHKQGVVHRDIKPSNIFVTTEGDVKLLDFGIAKIQEGITMTQTGSMMGTLMYMSPEQVEDSKHIDAKTDIYSLAVTFVHLLQGHAPYDSSTTSDYQIRKRIVEIPLELNEISAEWQNFLQPYLAKNPMERPALTAFNPNAAAAPQPTRSTHASEETFVGNAPTLPATDDECTVMDDAQTSFQQQVTPQPTMQPTEMSTPAPKKPKKKRKGLIIGLVIAVLVLAGGGIAAWLLLRNDYKDKHPAEFFNLRGHVKSVREEIVRDYGDGVSSTTYNFFEFNKDGYLIQGEVRDGDDDPRYWTYDKNKDQLVCSRDGEERCRILPFRVLNHNLGDNPFCYLLGLFYDDDAQAFIDDDIVYAKKYPIPFGSGCEITEGSLDDFIYKMQYNDEESHRRESGAFQYDGNDNLTQIKYHVEYYLSEWDDNRQENVYDFSKLCKNIGTRTYTYDSENRVTGWYYSDNTEKNGSVIDRYSGSWNISYNEQGDVAKIVQERDGERNTISFSYEYDKQGNWTSRTYVWGDTMVKSTRVIEYY